MLGSVVLVLATICGLYRIELPCAPKPYDYYSITTDLFHPLHPDFRDFQTTRLTITLIPRTNYWSAQDYLSICEKLKSDPVPVHLSWKEHRPVKQTHSPRIGVYHTIHVRTSLLYVIKNGTMVTNSLYRVECVCSIVDNLPVKEKLCEAWRNSTMPWNYVV